MFFGRILFNFEVELCTPVIIIRIPFECVRRRCLSIFVKSRRISEYEAGKRETEVDLDGIIHDDGIDKETKSTHFARRTGGRT